MQWQPRIRNHQLKEQIFCDWRRKWVRLTPEEWVRQHLLHSLVEDYHYPFALIAVEHPITVAELCKRCDAGVMSKQLQPLCIIELKAETVTLTQKVFDQVAVYNSRLGVDYFIISNGRETFACRLRQQDYEFLENIPSYQQLCQKR